MTTRNRYQRHLTHIRREMPLTPGQEQATERALVALMGDHILLPAQWPKSGIDLTPEQRLLLAIAEIAWLELRSKVPHLRQEAAAWFAYPDWQAPGGFSLAEVCEAFGVDTSTMRERARQRWLLGPGKERRVVYGRGRRGIHTISPLRSPTGRRKAAKQGQRAARRARRLLRAG